MWGSCSIFISYAPLTTDREPSHAMAFVFSLICTLDYSLNILIPCKNAVDGSDGAKTLTIPVKLFKFVSDNDESCYAKVCVLFSKVGLVCL